MTQVDFMKLALDKAYKGIDEGQTPFGACIVKDGEVVAVEHNNVWKSTDITAHAEICAIRRACERLGSVDLSGCEIYSTTEPCPMCFSAIHWAKIAKIFFGAAIEDARKAGFNELAISNEQMKASGQSGIVIAGGLCWEEAIGLFDYWKSKKGKAY